MQAILYTDKSCLAYLRECTGRAVALPLVSVLVAALVVSVVALA